MYFEGGWYFELNVHVCCLQMKGEAEAYAVEAKAKAEAEQMAKKADAWKEYQDAAMVDMVLETLPKVIDMTQGNDNSKDCSR